MYIYIKIVPLRCSRISDLDFTVDRNFVVIMMSVWFIHELFTYNTTSFQYAANKKTIKLKGII